MDTDDPTTVCGRVREVLSAVLDGEAGPDDAEWARGHLAGCPDCTRWADQAARLDRLLRISPVATDEPDLADTVLSQVRLPEPGRWRAPVRAALLLVALTQLVIGVVSLSGPIGMGMVMAMTAHMNHEEAAFNIAFGIALLRVAWDGRRAAGQVPVLAAFVLVLAVSSVFDLADGAVTWPRLLTHLPILLGLLLSATLSRLPTDQPGPLPRRVRWPDSGGQRRSADPTPPPPSARTEQHPPSPAARRDVA
jgi:predicted anti-sigma-YlaC factor YlaD